VRREGVKVRIGGQTLKDPSLYEVQKRVSKQILKGIVADVEELGDKEVTRIAGLIREVAVDEAHKLFATLGDLIGQMKDGDSLSAAQLMAGTSYATLTAFSDAETPRATGNMQWPSLTLAYWQRKKAQYPDVVNNFFQRTGAMKAEFTTFGASLSDNLLGGVDVTSSPTPMLPADLDDPTERAAQILMGSISVKIFPRVSPALLPGLASNAWTDVYMSGEFERDIFGDEEGAFRTGEKLANHIGHYRPFVAPAVQFWILTRIPNAIFRRLRTFLTKSRIP
jgi:hypothetical protein